MVLEIGDDGVEFDPGRSFLGHLGLRSMHERAQGIGGSLERDGRRPPQVGRCRTTPSGQLRLVRQAEHPENGKEPTGTT